MSPDYKVYILNANRERIARLKNLVVFDTEGNILKYAKQLSNYGYCKFRIGRNDPVLAQHGNILQPYKYGVEVTRGGITVWIGMIVNNPHRKRNYIDVMAYGYLFRWKKLQVNHDPELKPGDGLDNYRTFKSGTMAAAITATFNEGKTKAGGSDILASFTLGEITNPQFPDGFTKDDGSTLAGDWTFSDDMTLQFDYKSILYVWQTFGMYANCDMEITDDLKLNFKPYIGTRQNNIVFRYGRNGNILDYDVPLRGERTTNDLMGIAADLEGNVLHISQRDEASVADLGLLQDAEGFLDVKERNALKIRLSEEMRFRSTPDSSINVLLNERAHPVGKWGLGDTVTVKIGDPANIVVVDEARRITAYSIAVRNTGKEFVTVETNPERPDQ